MTISAWLDWLSPGRLLVSAIRAILLLVGWYGDHRIIKVRRPSNNRGDMPLHHPHPHELAPPMVLHALSDPQRLRIVRLLADRREPCACGSFGLDVTKSTLTHHFRVLREAGVIAQQASGTTKLNSLRRED